MTINNDASTSTGVPTKLAVTPGEAEVSNATVFVLNADGSNRISAQVQIGWEAEWNKGGKRTSSKEVHANAILYADAHNTFNATGHTPSELQAEVQRLRSSMEEVLGALDVLLDHTNKISAAHGVEIYAKMMDSPKAQNALAILSKYRKS